jgi:hypothetical protein
MCSGWSPLRQRARSYIHLCIAEANRRWPDEAAEEKRRAETEARDKRDATLKQVNEKFKNL